MFTEKGFKIVAKFLPPAANINILPFVVDIKKKQIGLNPSKKAFGWRLFYLFIELAYLSYNMVGLYIASTSDPVPGESSGDQTTHVTMHIIMGLKYGLGAGIMINIFFMADDMVEIFNEMVRLEVHFKEFIQEGSSYKESKLFERVALFFYGISLNSPSTFAFLFATLPNEYCYIYSLFPMEYKSYYTFGVFMVLEVFSSFKSIKTVCFYFMYFTIGVSFTAHWTSVLGAEDLSPKVHIKLYEELRVFNLLYNKSYFKFLLPFIIFIGGSFSVMSLVGALRFYGTVTLGAYMIYPVLILNSLSFIGLIFVLGAKIDTNSNEYMEMVKKDTFGTKEKDLKRKVDNLKPYGIRAYPYGNMEKVSFIVYLFAVIDNTISVLMTYPAEE